MCVTVCACVCTCVCVRAMCVHIHTVCDSVSAFFYPVHQSISVGDTALISGPSTDAQQTITG